jgi:hypothetical protein
MVMEFVAMCLGCALAGVALQVYRAHRAAATAAAWILVANMNMLLRLDLDHICGDDDNHGLREMRLALKDAAAKRSLAERSLFDRYNALVGVAIAFGEKVHDTAGNVDMRAVANRRAHLRNALALGDRLEAALGGIAELARDGELSRSDQAAQTSGTIVPSAVVTMNVNGGRGSAAKVRGRLVSGG